MRRFLTAALAGLLLGGALPARALDYAPKMLVRTGGGILSNKANGKSTLLTGGLNVLGELFLQPWLSAGLGFRADFDLANGTTPLIGFDLHGRVYFMGSGTRVRESLGDFTIEGKERWGAYVIGELSIRTYSLADSTTTFEGSLRNVNVGVGGDWALSRNFEINLEAQYSLLRFSSDPTRVSLGWILFSGGLGYLF